MGLVAVGVLVLMASGPASATVTSVGGNTNPQSQKIEGQCAPGERWVYASFSVEAQYNPLAKPTDYLGANSGAPPNSNADQFADGVTVTIVDTLHAMFTVNEATDPTTTITIGKFVIKADGHFTVFTGADATPGVALSDPPVNPTMGISHTFVCYSVTQVPTPVVPEAGVMALLPFSALLLGMCAVVVVHRRRVTV